MKISFLLPALSRGGAERVVSRLSERLSEMDHQVTVVTFRKSDQEYPLSPGVRRRVLMTDAIWHSPVLRNLAKYWQLYVALRRMKPDVVVSFLPKANVVAIPVARLLRTPVVFSERNNPALHSYSWSLRVLMRLLYRCADGFVAISNGVLEAFDWVRAPIRRTIYNPVPIHKTPDVRGPVAHVVGAMGRLVPAKGFDMLVDAFAQFANETATWDLMIAGTGPEYDNLTRRVKQKGLESRVELIGRVDDLDAFYRRVGLFVLSSRYEGFGNVITESMQRRCPVLAFDCDYGPREIIKDGVTGWLVPPMDVDALSQKLVKLCADTDLLSRVGEAASHDVNRRFSIDTIAEQWVEVLDEVRYNRHGRRHGR